MEKRKIKSKKTGGVNVRDVRYAASLAENNHLLISKLGSVYVNFHRPIDGQVKQVTIKRRGHRWFAIFSVERHVNETVDFQAVISEESKRQIPDKQGKLPAAVVACVGGGSNAIGAFAHYIGQ